MGSMIWGSPEPKIIEESKINVETNKKASSQAETNGTAQKNSKQTKETKKYNRDQFSVSQKDPHVPEEIDQKKIGVPHIENQYWQMLRNSKTKSLVNAFQNRLVTCNDVIVATSGHTIVHQSIIHSRREYFKLCEVYGADWNKPDLNGVTPLMKAAALNRVYFVEKLLQLGANKHLKDNRGMTALDYGILYDSFDSIDKINEVQD